MKTISMKLIPMEKTMKIITTETLFDQNIFEKGMVGENIFKETDDCDLWPSESSLAIKIIYPFDHDFDACISTIGGVRYKSYLWCKSFSYLRCHIAVSGRCHTKPSSSSMLILHASTALSADAKQTQCLETST